MIAIHAPDGQRAAAPAALRGLRRDQTRLCVVERGTRTVTHTTMSRLGEHLARGDLLVVNSSRVVPAALPVRRADRSVVQVRPAAMRAHGWDVLAVGPSPPHRPVRLRAGEVLSGPGTLRLGVVAARADVPHLWHTRIEAGDPLDELLRYGEPIRYSYVPASVPLEHYQPVYAGVPGSVESPSAGLHVSGELLGDLRRRGVDVADVVLHCTISSLQDDDADRHKPLIEEWFEVRAAAAAAVDRAQRVVAVGTSVVRALESSADDAGVHASHGWTTLAVTPRTRLRAVDALLTGLHESPATHLEMLLAFVDAALLERAYAEVRDRGYLWHEFGDAMLII